MPPVIQTAAKSLSPLFTPKIDRTSQSCQPPSMLKLIAASLAACLLLSSCGLLSRTLSVPGRTIQSLGRTFGF